jgi:hypothetical protein
MNHAARVPDAGRRGIGIRGIDVARPHRRHALDIFRRRHDAADAAVTRLHQDVVHARAAERFGIPPDNGFVESLRRRNIRRHQFVPEKACRFRHLTHLWLIGCWNHMLTATIWPYYLLLRPLLTT